MPRWLDIKIGQRILLGFGFAALLTLVVAAVSIYYLTSVGQRLTSVAGQDQLLLTSALELQVAVEQESDGIRGYLLSGDASFLEPFVLGQSHYSETAMSLEGLVQSQEDKGHLSEINMLHSKFLKVAEEEITLHDQGFPQSAIFLWQMQGNEIKSDLHAKLTSFVDRQERMISEHAQEAEAQQNQALAIALTLVVLAWAAGMAGGTWISRSITRPIKSLVSATEAISRGDLTTRTSIPGTDELASLGSAMNQMVKDLDESRRTVEHLLAQSERRAEQLRTINEVGRKISSVLGMDELLKYVVELLRSTFHFYNVNIFLLDVDPGYLVFKAGAGGYQAAGLLGTRLRVGEEGIVGWVAKAGAPLLANDVSKEPKYLPVEALKRTKSELAVPIKLGDAVVGVLDIESDEVDAFDGMDLFTAQTLADQIAIAVENARLYQETRDIAVLEERNRMAREIHDTLAQWFTGIILQLEVAEPSLGEGASKAREHLDRARSLARDGLQEAKRSVWNLRPRALEQLPLTEALKEQTQRFTEDSRVKAGLVVSGELRPLSAQVEAGLLRICQECLANVRKHAQASKVKVNLAFEESTVRLSVYDNGIGFDHETAREGAFGLISMSERARLLGGTLTVQGEVGKGTLVEVMIPTGH